MAGSLKHSIKKIPIPGIKHVILVSSAKGGVGKSTLSVNLALAIKQVTCGQVGILDADVYGPSLPKMMNLHGKPEVTHQKLMRPLINYGVQCMSMGFLINPKDSIVWRGLMVMSAVQKLLRGVQWDPLDYLLIDMPPGTGDTQLSISQNIPVSGAVIVTTPQDIALLDAGRGITMYRKVDVPLLGIVQNMSQFVCSNCGHKTHIFGRDGAAKLAEEEKVPFLGDVALDIKLRECSDNGRPVIVTHPDCESSMSLISIAKKLLTKLSSPLPS